MNITKEIEDLRVVLGINTVKKFDLILLDILAELARVASGHRQIIANIDESIVIHNNDDDRHITTAKGEELNRCPGCGNREIKLYSKDHEQVRYGCNQCFLRTTYHDSWRSAFEAWQAGDNG